MKMNLALQASVNLATEVALVRVVLPRIQRDIQHPGWQSKSLQLIADELIEVRQMSEYETSVV